MTQNITNPPYNVPEHNGQKNVGTTAYFLGILRHHEGFKVKKYVKITNNPNIKTFI